MRLTALAAALLISLAGAGGAIAGPPDELVSKGDFDFYVLALSWSPGFCDTGGAEKARDQCAVGAGQGFVVHGLWPDNADRPYPSDCGYVDNISGAALRLTHGLYPAEGLARYEYRRHGACTGLTPENYFAAVKYAREKLTIPPMLQAPHEALSVSPREIEDAFVAANPNLTTENFALTCSHGELTEVRICIPKTLDGYVDCPKIAHHSCHARTISVAPLR
jgi:ribonuclease T2